MQSSWQIRVGIRIEEGRRFRLGTSHIVPIPSRSAYIPRLSTWFCSPSARRASITFCPRNKQRSRWRLRSRSIELVRARSMRWGGVRGFLELIKETKSKMARTVRQTEPWSRSEKRTTQQLGKRRQMSKQSRHRRTRSWYQVHRRNRLLSKSTGASSSQCPSLLHSTGRQIPWTPSASHRSRQRPICKYMVYRRERWRMHPRG